MRVSNNGERIQRLSNCEGLTIYVYVEYNYILRDRVQLVHPLGALVPYLYYMATPYYFILSGYGKISFQRAPRATIHTNIVFCYVTKNMKSYVTDGYKNF